MNSPTALNTLYKIQFWNTTNIFVSFTVISLKSYTSNANL